MEEMNYSVSGEVANPEVNTGMDNVDTGINDAGEKLNNVIDGVNEGAENEGVNEEVADPQIEKPVQSQEQNALFAKMRRENEARVREAEIRARDNMIAEMNMEWNGQPIKTYSDYQKAIKEKQLMEEAQQRGIDPQAYTETQLLREEVASYRRESMLTQQDYELSADPIKGDLYNSWKDDIRQLADTHGCDLNTAFSVMLTDRIGEVLSMNQKKIQQETISKINENQSSTPGSLGASGEQPSLDAWTMSDNDFEAMKAKALRGELRR